LEATALRPDCRTRSGRPGRYPGQAGRPVPARLWRDRCGFSRWWESGPV